MALDAPKETDVTFVVGGFDYIVDRDLLDHLQPLTIDYTAMGFKVTGRLTPGSATSGCAGGGCAG
jgi:Fe-S cluster assembly iron-binding protein IscA